MGGWAAVGEGEKLKEREIFKMPERREYLRKTGSSWGRGKAGGPENNLQIG